jgi:hypothetical protein
MNAKFRKKPRLRFYEGFKKRLQHVRSGKGGRHGDVQAAADKDLFHEVHDSERYDLVGQRVGSAFDAQKL